MKLFPPSVYHRRKKLRDYGGGNNPSILSPRVFFSILLYHRSRLSRVICLRGTHLSAAFFLFYLFLNYHASKYNVPRVPRGDAIESAIVDERGRGSARDLRVFLPASRAELAGEIRLPFSKHTKARNKIRIYMYQEEDYISRSR